MPTNETKFLIKTPTLTRAFRYMATAKAMAEHYEKNFKQVSKYVHATSRGHEAIQIALGMQLLPQDYLAPYYRDDAMLLSIGMTPYELMLQLLAKKDDPFSGGRTYYSHPSLKDEDKPKIPHQSSSTGMQAIPMTGAAMGMQYRETMNMDQWEINQAPVAVCSLGDASVTEGEVAEAFQMAALKQLPILYLVQDNEWDISAHKEEFRAQDAYEYAHGFKGLEAYSIDGADFEEAYSTIKKIIKKIRQERRPFLLHATVPLLNHHTSGVRKEWYRDDLEKHQDRDPYPRMKAILLDAGVPERKIESIENQCRIRVERDFTRALTAEDPDPGHLFDHDFAPTSITSEAGIRKPVGKDKVTMVDCGLHALQQIMKEDMKCVVYGQDVGKRLGGVFRETATLADKFGRDRVFNTPIQEAFIVGSTVGMSAVGLKPIVEVQFADYLWPGLNQLFAEVSRSCYLSEGKWPVSMVLRVPIGAYGCGGPYHSSSMESIVCNIRGIKIAYPSNGADLFGLLKSAYDDPNPVVIFEHKGLYWSKKPGTEYAKSVVPSEDYRIPFGKGRMVVEADKDSMDHGEGLLIVTYGMGVHWARNSVAEYPGHIGILDLRTIYPLDETLIFEKTKAYGRVMVLTEEPVFGSFAQSLAGKIQEYCFEYLDAPVRTIGAENMPAIPINEEYEKRMIPSEEKVKKAIRELLQY